MFLRMGKKPVLESIFNKVADLQACNFIKMKLREWCFPVNIAKFLRTAFLKEHLWWLFLWFGLFFPSFNNGRLKSSKNWHVTVLLFYILTINIGMCAWINSNKKNKPANINFFKVNNRKTRKKYEICSMLTVKTTATSLTLF